jgi:hypothetical protein
MFPAYSKISGESTSVEPTASNEFLHNPSYDTIPVSSSTIGQPISSSSDSSDSEEYMKVVEDYKKPPSPPKVELFYVDRERKKEYLKLEFLPHRAVPFYKVTKKFKRFAQSNKRTFRRYFKVKRIKKLTEDPERLIDEKVAKDDELRIYLIKNSQEVDKWIEYIAFKVRQNSSLDFDALINCLI